MAQITYPNKVTGDQFTAAEATQIKTVVNANETIAINAQTAADNAQTAAANALISANAYADAIIAGVLKDRGNHDASTNQYPSTGGSGTSGAIKKGDLWFVNVAGALGGVSVTSGDTVRALIDTPGQTATNWAVAENNFGYTPESLANKDATGGYAGLTQFKINFKNSLNTITSFFTNANTAIRTYTFPDKSGTLAMLDDIVFAFLPSNINGLQVWYDCTDNNSIISNGSTLVQLVDKSGNNNHSNVLGTAAPTISTNPDTGKQALLMNGSTNYLPLNTELNDNYFTAFVVVKCTHSGLKVIMSALSSIDYIAILDGAGQIIIYNSTLSSQQDMSPHDYSYKKTAVIVFKKNADKILCGFNGRFIGVETSLNFTQPQKIGQLFKNNSGFNLSAFFSGFLYYNSFLSNSETDNIIKYLFSTHNLSYTGEPKKIIGFGDSITSGVGATVHSNCFLAKIATSLGGIEVNCGIAATPLQNTPFSPWPNGYPRNGFDRHNQNILEYNYKDNIYILYGTNDITFSLPVNIYQLQLDILVNNLLIRGYNKNNIYLGTPPYRNGNDLSAITISYGNAVKAIAAKYDTKVADIYTAMLNGGGDSLLADGLHPNNSGHQLIANTFLSA